MPSPYHLATRLRDMIWRLLLRIAALEAEAARAEASPASPREPTRPR
jgi:hypothetical protein